ncbi:anti-sigma factor family protein [Rhizobium sp. YTU87027]|uniref:anti-sigma factor family protein n=1 Tax=Rhizobium sp. YTU87027 TaxID=3417741 RepID=UPI003D6895CD
MSDESQKGCPEWSDMLHGFVDGELDSIHSAQFEAHLAGCASCSAALERVTAMREVIGEGGVKWRMPEEVRSRVLGSLSLENAANSEKLVAAEDGIWAQIFPFIRQWSLVPSLAALAASVFLFVNLPRGVDIEDQIVASHVHSLLADHLADVQTSDRHTVKPWFNGKVDFSPPVVDLAVQGFPLIGGRVDYIGGRVVAALIYRLRGHVINLFIWPGALTTQGSAEREGYNISEWSNGGLVFWAISDASAEDLAVFRKNFTAQAGLAPEKERP